MDHEGNFWIGALNGVCKFDGSSWTIYDSTNSGLVGNMVNEVMIDREGNKWMGMGDYELWHSMEGLGLAFFNDTTWTIYDTSNSGLPDNTINTLAEDGFGTTWIGTNNGLVNFDGINWTIYDTANSGLPDNQVNSIILDSSGNKWIGTEHGGLVKFNDATWTVYDVSNSGLPSNRITSILIDLNGNWWIGIDYGRLVIFDGINWVVHQPINWIGQNGNFFIERTGTLSRLIP